MTANALDDDVRRTREVDMDARLSKPIQPERLFGALEQLLNSSTFASASYKRALFPKIQEAQDDN